MSDLDAFFEPRSIAVVGASSNPWSAGGRVLTYLKEYFSGAVYPVNPNRDSLLDILCLASVDELPSGVDLAILAVPDGVLLEVVKGLVARQVRAALILTAGFAETGEDGQRRQDELVEVARGGGMRLWGPNTLGYANGPTGVYATFTVACLDGLPPGRVAVMSQSGAMGSIVLDISLRTGVDVGFYGATGNECDVTLPEVVEHVLQQDEFELGLVFAESIREPERWLRIAELSRRSRKPLLVIKAGSSDVGARAAVSHSGAVVGDDDVIDAIFREEGLIRCETFHEVLDTARLLLRGRPVEGRRLGIVTTSGGGGAMLADVASRCGLDVPLLPASDQDALMELMPPFASPRNPIDITAQVTAEAGLFASTLKRAAELESIDVLLAFLGGLDHLADDLVEAMIEVDKASSRPFAVCWTGGSDTFRHQLRDRGVLVVDEPERFMRAMAHAAAWHRTPEIKISVAGGEDDRAAEIATLLEEASGPTLDEHASKQVLQAYGLPMIQEAMIAPEDEISLLSAAQAVGYPVVLKAMLDGVAHKSDIGAVRVGLSDESRLLEAWKDFHHRWGAGGSLGGVLLQRMAPSGLEVLLGMRRDPLFGPMVVVGLGGVLVEIAAMAETGRPPATIAQARKLIERVAEGRLTSSPRGLSDAQTNGVARMLCQLGALAKDLPQIAEVDVNPLIVTDDELVVVDAVIVLQASEDEQ